MAASRLSRAATTSTRRWAWPMAQHTINDAVLHINMYTISLTEIWGPCQLHHRDMWKATTQRDVSSIQQSLRCQVWGHHRDWDWCRHSGRAGDLHLGRANGVWVLRWPLTRKVQIEWFPYFVVGGFYSGTWTVKDCIPVTDDFFGRSFASSTL